jgi:hypothetical protein
MSEIRDLLDREASRVQPTPGGFERVYDRVRRRTRMRRAFTVLAALTLPGLTLGWLWIAFGGGQRIQPPRPSNEGAPGVEVIRGADTIPPQAVVSAEIDVGRFLGSITSGFGSIWVAVPPFDVGDQSSIARIDPETNRVIASIPVDEYPGDIAAGEGAVWVAGNNSLLRIDPETNRLSSRIAGVGGFVTSTPGAVWAVASPDTVARVDPVKGEIVATVPLNLKPGQFVAAGPVGSSDSVWLVVTGPGDAGENAGELLRIDPGSNSVTARTALQGAPGTFVAEETGVWIPSWSDGETHLAYIGGQAGNVDMTSSVEGSWEPLAVGDGRLWLMGGYDGRHTRIAGLNLATLSIDVTVTLDLVPAYDGAGVFDPSTDSLWIPGYSGTVARLDLR